MWATWWRQEISNKLYKVSRTSRKTSLSTWEMSQICKLLDRHSRILRLIRIPTTIRKYRKRWLTILSISIYPPMDNKSRRRKVCHKLRRRIYPRKIRRCRSWRVNSTFCSLARRSLMPPLAWNAYNAKRFSTLPISTTTLLSEESVLVSRKKTKNNRRKSCKISRLNSHFVSLNN